MQIMEEYTKLPKNIAHTTNDSVAIHRILRNGTRDEILELLQQKTELNCINKDAYYMGDTVLHAILRNEKLIERHVTEILSVFLSQGVDPNITNKNEHTSLHLAVERRMKDAVSLLLKFEADVHAVNGDGDSVAHFFIKDEFQKYEAATLYPMMHAEENREIMDRRSVSFFKFLISQNVDFDLQNKGGTSALYSAIMYQLLHILPTLFEHTKDITFVDEDKTLLHYFLEERSLNLPDERPHFDYNSKYATRCVGILLERKVPILDCKKYGCTLISTAIKNREETDIIESLISYYLSYCDNIRIATALHNELISTCDFWSPSECEYFMIVLSDVEMKIADMKNNVPLNKRELIQKSIINRYDIMRTPLHVAAMLNEVADANDLLLRKGADVNAMDSAGHTPLHLAVSQNNVEIVKLLLEHGAFVNCKDNYQKTPLHLVRWTTNEALEIVDLLVSKGADVNARDPASEKPFHLAVRNNNVAVVQLLLQNGASVNCRNSFQMTPLHRALLSETVSVQMVELLLTSGAKVNTKDYKGDTPLHVAVFKNNLPIVRLLLEHGAFVMCTNKHGQTPLHCAVIDGSVDIVELLLTNGADVNVKDCKGNTPLYYVCNRWTLNHSSECLLKMLLEKGAYVDLQNNKGETVLSIAQKPGNESLADRLIDYDDSKIRFLEDPRCEVVFQDSIDYLVDIKMLKSTKIDNHKSLYDFLLMSPRRRCSYLNSEKLQKLVESPKLHELFPVYSNVIRDRYQEAVMRKSLLKSAQEALSAMTRIQLPTSVDKILAHMEKKDLINLAQATFYDE